MRVKVHAANISEAEGAKLLFEGLKSAFPDLAMLWADGGYGKPEGEFVV